MKIKKIYLIILFVSVSLISCYTYQVQSSRSKNLAYIYNPHDATIHPEYTIFHKSDSQSELNIRILKKELFFVKVPNTNKRFANIKIKYKIYNSFKNRMIIDSASVFYDFKYSITKDTIDLSVNLKLPKDSTFSALIKLTDLNRERTERAYLFINKKTYAHENIKLINKESNQLLFHNWADTSSQYLIEKRYNKPLYAFYYSKLPLALPPFATTSSKFNINNPDSVFDVRTNALKFNKEGLYLLSFDKNIKKGTYIVVSSKTYPEFKTPSKLLQPIRYISSKKEYMRILQTENKKIALDSYWLNKTGSASRARQLIKIFYTRVRLANYYFTSYKEGWKTDKGLIYIIYGNPTTVYKSDHLEKWIYGDSDVNTGLVFLFRRDESNGIPNNYKLERSPDYKSSWFQAVDTWRNGRAFAIVN